MMIQIGNVAVHKDSHMTKARFKKLFKNKYKGDLNFGFEEYKKKKKELEKALLK